MTLLTDIHTVTICCSSKFYSAAKPLAKELEQQGITVYTPRFDFDEEFVEVAVTDKINLTLEFLEKIRKSDAIYVIDENGYTGRSVCIEAGFARALGRKIILSEEPEEGAVAALTDAVVPVDAIAGQLGGRRP